MRARLICLLVLAIPAIGHAAEAPVELQPSSKWNLSYQDGSCILLRSFAQGDRQIIAMFTRFAPGDSFSLRLLGKPFRNDTPFQDVRFAFGETPAVRPLRNRLSGRAVDLPFVELGGTDLAGSSDRASDEEVSLTADQEAAVDTLTIGPYRGKTYRLKMGSMRAPMRAMRTCTDDLVKFWGYDPVVMATLRSKPVPRTSPGRWLGSNDYPHGLLLNGQLGSVEFRLDVDETGAVIGCSVLRRAGDEDFAKVSCSLLKRRATFQPAIDAAGKPVRSFYINRVNWVQGL